MSASRPISSQLTPVMNEWCWHSFINQVVALLLGDEEGMGNIVVDVVAVVDWGIHENAAV